MRTTQFVSQAAYVASVRNMVWATVVYIGRDYVFVGNRAGPYTEGDSPNPINV